MKELCIDVETTISNNGNPFDHSNTLVSIGYGNTNNIACTRGVFSDKIQTAIQQGDVLVGFNIKFDLHWLRKCGFVFDNIRIWDCQLAEYILSRQRTKYPSLNNSLLKYNLEPKLDIVKTEYWDKGINTDQIPWEILSKYNIQDVKQTLELYYKQQEITTPMQKRLIHLCCEDLLTLQEMEFNGLPMDLDGCATESVKVQAEIKEITERLASRYPHIPINFNSTDHLSAFLYGGNIDEDSKELVGVFKTGAKAGQPKFKNITTTHTLSGLVTPIKGSELKKENIFSTAEDTLKQLKDKTGAVKDLLKLAQLTKVNEFFESFININKTTNWPANRIHGQFNQVSTSTARLSSAKPNLQNMCPEIQTFARSEYE